MLSVIGNALRVSEPLRKYRHSEGREKISERDSIYVKEKTLNPFNIQSLAGDIAGSRVPDIGC